jgi:hypothetical protein
MATKKKHHFISQFILKSFANEKEQLEVHRLGGGKPYLARVSDIAHRNNAFRVERLEDDPTFFEDRHAELEGDVAAVFERWTRPGVTSVSSSDRSLVERFIVLHMMRWPALSDNIGENIDVHLNGFGAIANDPRAKALKRDLLVHAVSFAAIQHTDRHSDPQARAERWEQYEHHLNAFYWQLITFEEPVLLIGDRLVCGHGDVASHVRSTAWDRSTYGTGGLATWTRVTIPISPHVGLLLARDPKLVSLRPERFNQTTIRNSREFIAYSPQWRRDSPVVHAHAEADLGNQVRVTSVSHQPNA